MKRRGPQQKAPQNGRGGQRNPRGGAPRNNKKGNQALGGMAETKNVKVKKPVTKGTVVALTIIVSFIWLLLFSAALIFVAVTRSASQEAIFQQTLMDAENTVKEASVNVAFAPALSIRSKAMSPSVNLEVTRGGAAPVEEPAPEPQPEEQPPVEQQAGENGTVTFGAGVVVSQQGELFYILTNNHVVKDASSIMATINDEEYKADFVAADETSDLAVVSVKAKGLSVATIGQSGNVEVGDYTLSVGNPYGLNDSMSSGMISGLGRDMLYIDGAVQIMYANMIQTDAAINPGNSGGGLFNANGELIGINTLVSGDESHSDNIGYAIPADYAMPIAQNLIAGKPGAHASFGVALSNVPNDAVSKYGLDSSDGAYVNSITPSGPAEVAGLVPNDIIIEYDGKKIQDAQDMLYKIRASVINDNKEIKILREGKEMTLTIKIGSDA